MKPLSALRAGCAVGAVLVLDLRQRRGDDRLRERERHSRQQEGQEDDSGVILAVQHEAEA